MQLPAAAQFEEAPALGRHDLHVRPLREERDHAGIRRIVLRELAGRERVVPDAECVAAGHGDVGALQEEHQVELQATRGFATDDGLEASGHVADGPEALEGVGQPPAPAADGIVDVEMFFRNIDSDVDCFRFHAMLSLSGG